MKNFRTNYRYSKLNDLNVNGQNIIENSEKLLSILLRKDLNSSLIKFDEAMKQTIEMASAAYKNEEGLLEFQLGLEI